MMRNYEIEEQVKTVLAKCEGLMELSFKLSGMSMTEALSNMDAETGAMFGGAMELYKESKELTILQAKGLDKILNYLKDVCEANEELRKQNMKQQAMLEDLNRKIEKIGK